MVGHYALKHPEQVEKLILLSSVGVLEQPERLMRDNFISQREQMVSRYGARWVQDTWTNGNLALNDLYRVVGYRMAKKLLMRGLVRRIGHETAVFEEGEREMLLEWIL